MWEGEWVREWMWLSEWMSEREHEWTSESERASEWEDGQWMSKWVSEWVSESECMNKWASEWDMVYYPQVKFLPINNTTSFSLFSKIIHTWMETVEGGARHVHKRSIKAMHPHLQVLLVARIGTGVVPVERWQLDTVHFERSQELVHEPSDRPPQLYHHWVSWTLGKVADNVLELCQWCCF